MPKSAPVPPAVDIRIEHYEDDRGLGHVVGLIDVTDADNPTPKHCNIKDNRAQALRWAVNRVARERGWLLVDVVDTDTIQS